MAQNNVVRWSLTIRPIDRRGMSLSRKYVTNTEDEHPRGVFSIFILIKQTKNQTTTVR